MGLDIYFTYEFFISAMIWGEGVGQGSEWARRSPGGELMKASESSILGQSTEMK